MILLCFHFIFLSTFTVFIILKVCGSNENRPKILPGNTVRLRPLLEDIESLSVKRYPYLMHQFELTGIILSYKLASESCLVEFSIPIVENILSLDRAWKEYKGLWKSEIISMLNELRYHVRFSFERSGLAFTHMGKCVTSLSVLLFCSVNSKLTH